MNFTREPIIETVITPKEGYKLVVRNSKVGGQEEYFVDAVEVISFGSASFFRSMEKPKCFLVPVSDFEILEARESRMVLKTPTSERGIKIAGGREAPMKVKEESATTEEVSSVSTEQRPDKRREKRRPRKRRAEDEETQDEPSTAERKPEEKKADEKRPERPTLLIPPPTTLISESIVRYKNLAAGEELTQELPSQEVKEPPRAIIPPPPLVLRKEKEEKEEEEEEDFNVEETPF